MPSLTACSTCRSTLPGDPVLADEQALKDRLEEAVTHLRNESFDKALDCALVAVKLQPDRSLCEGDLSIAPLQLLAELQPFHMGQSGSYYHRWVCTTVLHYARVKCWAVLAEAQMGLGHYRAALSAAR